MTSTAPTTQKKACRIQDCWSEAVTGDLCGRHSNGAAVEQVRICRICKTSPPRSDRSDYCAKCWGRIGKTPAGIKAKIADAQKHGGYTPCTLCGNLCLGNKLRTIHSKRMKNPICRTGNVSLSGHFDGNDFGQGDDDFCHAHSEHLRKRCQLQERQREARHTLGEFTEFLKREDSSVLPTMEAIAAAATPGAAAEMLGMSETGFCRVRSRLRQLGRCFEKRESVPSRRRPYRTRTKQH
jgi:hypothetical protein